eukprot:2490849-Rhodomonas_salina.2
MTWQERAAIGKRTSRPYVGDAGEKGGPGAVRKDVCERHRHWQQHARFASEAARAGPLVTPPLVPAGAHRIRY